MLAEQNESNRWHVVDAGHAGCTCGAGLMADISREQDTVLEVQRRERQWSRISICVDGASDTEFGPADLILARINISAVCHFDDSPFHGLPTFVDQLRRKATPIHLAQGDEAYLPLLN